MIALGTRKRTALITALSKALGKDPRHRRSWEGYLHTMSFYQAEDGRIYALRLPQIMKTVYVTGSNAPADEAGAREAWITRNVARARQMLPSQGSIVLVPVRNGTGDEVFCEVLPRPRHTCDDCSPPPEDEIDDILVAADAVLESFKSKLPGAWSRYGALVVPPEPKRSRCRRRV